MSPISQSVCLIIMCVPSTFQYHIYANWRLCIPIACEQGERPIGRDRRVWIFLWEKWGSLVPYGNPCAPEIDSSQTTEMRIVSESRHMSSISPLIGCVSHVFHSCFCFCNPTGLSPRHDEAPIFEECLLMMAKILSLSSWISHITCMPLWGLKLAQLEELLIFQQTPQ